MPPTAFQNAAFRIESFIMQRLVPLEGPGLMKWVFKLPILFYRLGLGGLVGKQFLMLETTGRRSGKTRRTVIGYSRESSGAAIVLSGWQGRTDWYCNALAHPQVCVQIGRQRFDALAQQLTDVEVADQLEAVLRINPAGLGMFARWSRVPLDGSRACLEQAAPDFPGLRLVLTNPQPG